MQRGAITLLALALATNHLAWGGQDTRAKPAPKDKSNARPAVLLDEPQGGSILFADGRRRLVYLVKLTPDELTYKSSARSEEVLRYSAREGNITEVRTSRGVTFTYHPSSGTFQARKVEPPPDPKAAAGKEADQPLQMTTLEQEILEQANQARQKEGLPPLKVNAKLFQLARAHSANMAKQDKLDHILDGKDPGQRAKEAGYPAYVAENCAWGPRSGAEVVRGWMNSPGHRANLLNKQATEAGVGHATSERGATYYTMVFGLRKAP
jgi:uncharacterized protein YkwD